MTVALHALNCSQSAVICIQGIDVLQPPGWLC